MVDFDIAQIFLVVFAGLGVVFTIFEVYMRWLDLKPRVRVTIYKLNLPDPSEHSKVTSEKEFYEIYERLPNHVFIRAQNVGNKPVTLISPIIRMPGTMVYAPDLQTGMSKWESNVSFPHELMPAKSCIVHAPTEDVIGYLKRGGQKGKIIIRASYLGEVGNEYYSKRTWSERLKRAGKEGRELTIMLDTSPESDKKESSK
jgi:hypothetical protein